MQFRNFNWKLSKYLALFSSLCVSFNNNINNKTTPFPFENAIYNEGLVYSTVYHYGIILMTSFLLDVFFFVNLLFCFPFSVKE